MDTVERSEFLISKIKERAKVLVTDNITNPTPSDFLFAENAMLIGASIAEQLRAMEELGDLHSFDEAFPE